jgi:MFS family permease
VLRRLANTVIWSYRPGVTDETLLRHARYAEGVVTIAFGASVLMASAMLELVLSEPGWWRALWFWIASGATLVAILTFIPGLMALVVAHEALRSLKDKFAGQRLFERLDLKLPVFAAKMMAYFSLLVLSALVAGNDPTRRATAAAIVFGLFISALVHRLLKRRHAAA